MAESPPVSAPSKARVFFRRTLSTVGLWGLVAAVFLSQNAIAYLGLIVVLISLSTLEYFQMLRNAGVKCFTGFGHALSLGYSVALAASFLSRKTSPDFALEAPVSLDAAAMAVAVIGAFCLQLRRPIRGLEPIQAVASNILGFIYIPFLFGFAARLVFLVPGSGQVPGALLLLWLIAVTKFTDMGAYLTGSLIGKHKMIPHVSPGKTWEGFGGALFFSQLAGCGLFALFPNQLAILGGWPHVIGLGVLLALLSVVGDLAESVLKRSLNAKDSGQMLPGIGGALDLIDSLCFTAPALYFYLKWVQP
jgi:phosphatidate cytidylyltransferase